MKIPDIGNIGNYEFGDGGKKKFPHWVDTRTKPDPNAPYGVDDSKYSSPKLKKWGITTDREAKVFKDLWNKLDCRVYPGCTVSQYKKYVHQYLGVFLVLHKKWPEAYELLMQSDFKIYFITSDANWRDVYKKHFFRKNNAVHTINKNLVNDLEPCAGFFSPESNPPGLYINASNKADYSGVASIVAHETLHALDFFAGKYYSDVFLSEMFYVDFYIKNYNKRLLFVKKKFLISRKTCKTKNERDEKELKLIKDYHLWFTYFTADENNKFLPDPSDLEKVPLEFFVEALMCYLLHPQRLKSSDRDLYDFIEEEIKSKIKTANFGLKKQKLFKPK